jgi:squalene-hopene/tetraprenyl-beta-curcumene cyclase
VPVHPSDQFGTRRFFLIANLLLTISMVTPTTSTASPRVENSLGTQPGGSHRVASGIDWQREWDSPIVATAMAVSALVSSEQHGSQLGTDEHPPSDSAYQGDLSELLIGSLHWLAQRQLPLGGWSAMGDDRHNLATTMLVRATFALTGLPVAYPTLAERMQGFIDLHGAIDGVKARYGPQSVATRIIYGTWSLADLIDWNRWTALPIETFVADGTPSRTQTWQVADDMLAPLLALGVASFKLHRPFNPLTSWRRGHAAPRVLAYLQATQNPSGSFADSVAATSVVVMSLAGAGLTNSPVVRRGVEYLFESVGSDGSWSGKSTAVNPAPTPAEHSIPSRPA